MVRDQRPGNIFYIFNVFYEFMGFMYEYSLNPAWLLKDWLWAAIKVYKQSHLTFQTSKHNNLDTNLHIPNAKPDCVFLSSVTVPPTLAPGGPAAPALPGRPLCPLSPRSPCGEIHK